MAKKPKSIDAPKSDMTPMIDMVFQLLIFFILMFKIVTPEGDFSIRMPAMGGPSDGPPQSPIVIQLKAKPNGNLDEVKVGSLEFPGSPEGRKQLRAYMRKELAGTAMEAAATEIELDCDYQLKYRNVINTISDCTGYVENGRIVKLAEKIKFRPQRKQR